MKILDWNVFDKNKNEPLQIFNFISSQKPDIVCLQEVTPKLLEFLRNQNEFQLDYAIDYYEKGKTFYLATLSRLKVKNRIRITLPKLSRSIIQYFQDLYEEVEFLYLDLDIDNKLYRIFNCHFSYGHNSEIKLTEFREIVKRFSKSRINIICGDFNTWYKLGVYTFAAPLFFGFHIKDSFENETIKFKKVFEQFSLKDPFEGQITFSKFSGIMQNKLDYILVPENLTIKNKEILKVKSGSDHFPILVEI